MWSTAGRNFACNTACLSPRRPRAAAKLNENFPKIFGELVRGSHNRAVMELSWKPYGPGHIALGIQGSYLAYQNFDLELKKVRWFAKYEGSSDDFLKQAEWIDFHFFDSLEDAQTRCEEHAQAMEP
jgi:hypothetical protein